MTAPARSGWLDSLVEHYERDPDYVAEAVAIHLIEEALARMAEEGTTQAELAKLMGVSPQRISQIFNAPPNLTLRSIAQLAIALGSRPHASLFPACPQREGGAVLRLGKEPHAGTGVVEVAPATASGWAPSRELVEASA